MAAAHATHIHVSSKQAKGPDPGRVRDQLQALQHQYKSLGPVGFSEQNFWILRKNQEAGELDPLKDKGKYWNRRLVPFHHNRIQRDLDEKIFGWDSNKSRVCFPLSSKNILLKPRQAGYTTYFIIMRLLMPALIEPGIGCLLISQNNHYAAIHFSMLRRALKYFLVRDPYDRSQNRASEEFHTNLLHMAASNRREIIFDQLDSRILCDSAEVEETGQGLTLQHVVATEVARWEGNPEETLANMKEAIADGGTLDLESTANGHGGYFFEECMRASDPKNKIKEFKFHFHEWWWHDEYRRDPVKYRVSEETLTDEEKRLHENYPPKIDLEQIAFRREKKLSLRHNFDEKYPEDPRTCFLVTGNTFFDRDILRYRYQELAGYKPHARFRKIAVYQRRIKGREYIIGADPATGKAVSTDDPDYSAAVVMDKWTGEEVAAYRSRLTEVEFAEDLAELGRTYNNALVAVERQGGGGVVLTHMEISCGYGNLYKHKDLFKRDKKKVVELLGFPTTMKTRGLALGWLRAFVKRNPELIWDIDFINEALMFVYNEQGKPEAAEGCHDDTVMCRAIGYYVRMVACGFYDPVSGKLSESWKKVSEDDYEYETEEDEVTAEPETYLN